MRSLPLWSSHYLTVNCNDMVYLKVVSAMDVKKKVEQDKKGLGSREVATVALLNGAQYRLH